MQTVGEKCKKEKVQACVEAMQIEALGAGHSVAKVNLIKECHDMLTASVCVSVDCDFML